MIAPGLTIDEPLRLVALRDMCQLDSPLEARFERITRVAQMLIQVPMAAVSLVDADRQWFKSITGLDATQTNRDVSFCGHTILQDEPLRICDVSKDERFADNPLVTGVPYIRSYLGVPVRSPEGYRIGSLCVIDVVPRDFTPVEVALLEDLAGLTELELSRSMQTAAQRELMREVRELRRASQVDDLTRLWNRAALFELMETEHRQAVAAGRGLGVLMADVDHFKLVNDSLGHAAGDRVMRDVSKRMLGLLRDVDALGRYGGDEFVIVPGPAEGIAVLEGIAERLRAGIEADFTPTGGEVGSAGVTLSVGVAYVEHAREVTPEVLLATADAALYEAKRGGRNRVVTKQLTERSAAGMDAA